MHEWHEGDAEIRVLQDYRRKESSRSFTHSAIGHLFTQRRPNPSRKPIIVLRNFKWVCRISRAWTGAGSLPQPRAWEKEGSVTVPAVESLRHKRGCPRCCQDDGRHVGIPTITPHDWRRRMAWCCRPPSHRNRYSCCITTGGNWTKSVASNSTANSNRFCLAHSMAAFALELGTLVARLQWGTQRSTR